MRFECKAVVLPSGRAWGVENTYQRAHASSEFIIPFFQIQGSQKTRSERLTLKGGDAPETCRKASLPVRVVVVAATAHPIPRLVTLQHGALASTARPAQIEIRVRDEGLGMSRLLATVALLLAREVVVVASRTDPVVALEALRTPLAARLTPALSSAPLPRVAIRQATGGGKTRQLRLRRPGCRRRRRMHRLARNQLHRR